MDSRQHGTEEQIECYALGTLPEPQIAMLEEHLLICDACRERVEGAETFHLAMREALIEDARTAPATRPGWLEWFAASFRKPAFSMALALVVVVAGLGVYSGSRNALPAVAMLQLTATRGEMPSIAPARELDLTLIGAPADGGPFRVELVDAQGHNVWGGLADSEGDAVLVKVPARIQPGDYFVRLYSGDGPLLHEYGFRVGK